MAYVKIADTVHGELGHNGWTWVLNNPFPSEDKDHPAYYEECGALFYHGDHDGRNYVVQFRKIFGVSRSGLVRDADILIDVTDEQVGVARANRAAYDAVHKPVDGYRVITD